MRNLPKPALIAVAVIALVAIVAGTWAIATRGLSSPAGHDEHVEAAEPLVDDPELAATSAMTGLMTWQPAKQDSPQAAAAAISERLTGQLEEYATADEADPVLPDMWNQWAEAGDSIHAVATVDSPSSVGESEDQAVIDVVVDQEVWHPSGDRTPYSRFTAAVTVENVAGQWKAARYEISDIEY